MKHINIPVFVPHLGCPHDCVFCNQRTITGKSEFDISHVRQDITDALSTVDIENTEAEIAFFGGSFTGIERELMVNLLEISDEFYDKGMIKSVRCSTRPDYIDREILDILKSHHVRTVEIGIQSMSDKVLEASARGHTSAETENACRMIVDKGFDLVGQMMIGLPCSSVEDEIMTAERICSFGAVGARIYPTVVFRKTALCTMAEEGSYDPLTVDEAVERSAEVLGIFADNGVDVIRIGLCESEGLHSDSGIYAGAFHPAFGELCISEYYYKKFKNSLNDIQSGKVTIYVSKGSLSKAVGQHGKNRIRLKTLYPDIDIKFAEDECLNKYDFKVLSENGEK